MALPSNPDFSPARLALYNARLRGLGVGASVEREIASYLGVGANTVRAWLYPQAELPGATVQDVEVRPWAEGNRKSELLSIISRSRRNFTREDVIAYLADAYGIQLAKATTKAELISLMSAPAFKKAKVGALMDALRPLEVTTERTGAPRRLPDMLPAEEYQGYQLSDFARGTLLRKKADLALALIGEVTQTPQDGVDEGSFLRRASSLEEAEEAILWPLRWGVGIASWLDPFIAEMWFRATLRPGPDVGRAPGADALTGWIVVVRYYRVYEAEELDFSSGWPIRDRLRKTGKRTEAQIKAKLKEEADWEEYRKQKRKKAAQKRKKR